MPFRANQMMRDSAARALEYRRTLPPSAKFGTAVGIARARDIANGELLSPETILRMYSYLARTEDIFRAQDAMPANRRGKQWWATQLWGGKAAYAWVDDKLKRLRQAGEI